MTLVSDRRAPEVKLMPLNRVAAQAGQGLIRGHASLFGVPDQSGDVVAKGAFAASLARLRAEGRAVKFLWQHDPSRPIGVWDRVLEDGRGLFVEGRILKDLTLGADALTLMQAGAIDGLSIGYRTVRAEANRQTGGRTLKEVELWEVSLVTFPMLPSARASLTASGTEVEAFADVLAEVLAGGDPGGLST